MRGWDLRVSAAALHFTAGLRFAVPRSHAGYSQYKVWEPESATLAAICCRRSSEREAVSVRLRLQLDLRRPSCNRNSGARAGLLVNQFDRGFDFFNEACGQWCVAELTCGLLTVADHPVQKIGDDLSFLRVFRLLRDQ
jgi:hypothetical protein